MKKFMFLAMSILIMNSYSFAGAHGLTHHSRANCGNNESISWDLTKSWSTWVNSDHYKNADWVHGTPSYWQFTWRNAVVHWGEAINNPGWAVYGRHWTAEGGIIKYYDEEYVTDCSIYDGWWG